MNHSPKVSVIIPTYNSSQTIAETLISVFNQTFQDFEIILINDGSTDSLMTVLAPIDDNRLKIFHYENSGLPTARNRGIDRASGEYLIFLDADDFWTSDKLETHVSALDLSKKTNPRAGLVYSWSYFLDDETREYFINQPNAYEGDVLVNILESNFITSGSNPMITRDAIESVGYFNPEFKSAEDWEYWIRLAQKWDYLLVPQRQVFYRQSRRSMSAQVPKMEREQLRVIDSVFPSLPSNLQPIKSIAYSNIYFYCAQLYLRYPPSRAIAMLVREKLWKAIVTHPAHLQNPKTYVVWIKSWMIHIFPQQWFQMIQNSYRQLKSPRLFSQKLEL